MKYSGSCHCQRIKFECEFELNQPAICNCSYCSKRNSIVHVADTVNINQGQDELTCYRFNKMKAEHITDEQDNIFEDIGFEAAEAVNLKMRAHLLLAARAYIRKHKLTQTAAAKAMGVDQPQISRLLKAEINHFSVDKLLVMLARVGINVKLTIPSETKSSHKKHPAKRRQKHADQ